MPKESKTVTVDKIRKIVNTPGASLHFIGIGGVSMHSLAALALKKGARITGSDVVDSKRTKELSALGANISIGHSGSLIYGTSLAVYSHAISEYNQELLTARTLGIPTVSRAELLGAMMLDYGKKIGVSGSHGKSSTVAMLDAIFSLAGRVPTVLSGANLTHGRPYKIGKKDYLIYEACEYKDSFLRFCPDVFVALNLELDHPDYFKSLADLRESFSKAMNRTSGFSVINSDDEQLMRASRTSRKRVVTYGQGDRAIYRYRIIEFRRGGFSFVLMKNGEKRGRFELNIPGIFNVSNAVAAIVTALECGIDVDTARLAIAEYRGIDERIQLVGEHLGRPLYYDYAHHPTEIASTINALKMQTHDQITVVFKPHTYSRTQSLWEDFRRALSLADFVIMTDIYPAREAPIAGVSSRRLAQEIGEFAYFCEDGEVVGTIDASTHGVIVIMGAGGLENIRADLEIKEPKN